MPLSLALEALRSRRSVIGPSVRRHAGHPPRPGSAPSLV